MHVVTARGGRCTFARMTSPISSAEARRRSRRSWTRAEQAAHLAEFAASGLSATAFCRRLGVGRSTLTRWRQRAAARPTPPQRPTPQRRGRPAAPRRAAGSGFAAVAVVPDAGSASSTRQTPGTSTRAGTSVLTLVLRAPSGVAADVTGLDLATAAALLRAVLTPAAAAGRAGVETPG